MWVTIPTWTSRAASSAPCAKPARGTIPHKPARKAPGSPADVDVKARIDGMQEMARDGSRETLANLKQVAEG
jgi:hypothetical protein